MGKRIHEARGEVESAARNISRQRVLEAVAIVASVAENRASAGKVPAHEVGVPKGAAY